MNGSVRSATQLVSQFNSVRAVVVGDAMLDTYVDGNVSRICKEGPVPVVDWNGERSEPGGAANVAANLAALGAEVRFAGLIGSDTPGRSLREAIGAFGIPANGLIEDQSCTTLHKLRISARGQYLVRLDSGETQKCGKETRRRLLHALEAMIEDCDLVVVSDYGYGTVDRRIIDRLSILRIAHPFVLAVDAKHPMQYATVPMSVLTPNLAEACDAVDMPLNESSAVNLDFALAVTKALRQRVAADYLAVTLAGDGVLVASRRGEVAHVPSRPLPLAHDIGAGDTFIAALGLSLAAGAAPKEAVEIGIEAAMLAVTQEQTAVVDQQQLLRRVSLADRVAGPTVASILPLINAAQLCGKSIVFTNGVFDILHVGHVELLRRAKALGDVLVVGLNSDASTQRLKGPTRPINAERDRLALVSALEPVDFAVLFDEDTPEQLIRTLRPDVHVKGGDYQPADLPESKAVAEVGGRIEILPFVEDRSTTRVIELIRGESPAYVVEMRS
jgi:D-beta-D-heptose 7-phosphate kinase/D-beta-D-heptose 1-phosphate adenosyltransferase